MYYLTYEDTRQFAFFETAKELLKDDIEPDTFIAEMIKAHFQDANIEVIQKMWKWAENPFKQISQAEIKYIMTKEIEDSNQKPSEIRDWEQAIQAIYNATELGIVHIYDNRSRISLKSFNDMKCRFYQADDHILGQLGYMLNHSSFYLMYHFQCADIIHSLWSKRIEYNNEILTCSLNDLSSQLQDLTDEVQRLKRKNEALEYQLESKQYELRRLTSKVNKIEHHLPTEIVEYDYDAIKERLDPIREELSIVQRTFRRIIHAQYKVPIAVLVGKN